MSTDQNQPDPELDKIDKDISNHRFRAFLLVVLISVLYIYLSDKTLSTTAQAWGTFGDFIGGILNPIFALFAFYWLTYSVRLQIKELRETRAELEKSTIAQEETAKHQKSIAELEQSNVETQKDILALQKKSLESQIAAGQAQQQQIAIQNFENLFFELLKAKIDVTENIIFISTKRIRNPNTSLGMLSTESNSIRGKSAIEEHILKFKKNSLQEEWYEYYTDNLLAHFGSYFRLNYQIIKLIDNNKELRSFDFFTNKGYSSKQKEYFDIFRATFNQYELEAFFFNCLSDYGNTKFKKLIEKYGLFEPLLLDGNYENNFFHRLTRYAYQYDPCIFEKNSEWAIYNESMKNLKTVDFTLLIDQIILLKKYKFITYFDDISPYPDLITTSGVDFNENTKKLLDSVFWSYFKGYSATNISNELKLMIDRFTNNIVEHENNLISLEGKFHPSSPAYAEEFEDLNYAIIHCQNTKSALESITYLSEIITIID